MTLDKLDIGDYCIVKKINTTNSIRRRLLDIGLIPNTKVSCLYKSPIGNIKAYLIRNSIIAIRKNDASMIEVESYD